MDASLFRLRGGLRTLSRATLSYRQTEIGKQITRSASTLTETESSATTPIVRTLEGDPRKHTLDHVGLFYNVNQTEMSNVLRKLVNPSQQRLIKTFNEASFMVREPSIELKGYLQNINYDHPVNRFILYGVTGAGKSNCLIHTIHCCHRNNWIIVNVPWGSKWVRGFKKEVAESSYKTGRIDLPTDAAEWLSYFRLQNHGKLKELKTTSEYVWTRREKAEIGTPLEELINFGLNRLKFSSDVVGALLKELRLQAKTSGIKVLVAVEGVNGFFVQWKNNHSLKNAEKKLVEPHEISLVHNMKKMFAPTWSNGAVVCTVDIEATGHRDNYMPFYLLGQEGIEAFDPFVPILVPEYTEKEAHNVIQYYIDRNWIHHQRAKTEEGKKEIIFISNKNPFSLYTVCSSL